jgi:hypothetical protein
MVKPKKTSTPMPTKRGRPYAGGRDPLIGVRMPVDVRDAIDAAAGQEKDSTPTRSEMIRRIVTDWLRRRGYLKGIS